MKPELIESGADFSADRVYRYKLWRRWANGPMLAVVGLNPSTADETVDDPTVRRCIGYARRWGFAGLTMLNLFAFRSTDPKAMKAHYALDPSDIERNCEIVLSNVRITDLEGGAMLAAWGAHGDFMEEGRTLKHLLARDGFDVACLGKTASGEPKHPLYLPRHAKPITFIGDGGQLVTGMSANESLAANQV